MICNSNRYFLEQRQGAFKVDNNALKSLIKLKPSIPQYILSNRNLPSKLVKNWNLIIPKNILNQSWEEPDHDI